MSLPSGSRSGRRPKLLFVAHGFPPARNIGSVRTGNMAKYLARAGWDITVVTPNASLLRHVEDSEVRATALAREGVQWLSTGHGWRCLAPSTLKCRNDGVAWAVGGLCRRLARRLGVDNAIGWLKAAEDACAHLAPSDVDIILASGPPFTAFELAERLAGRFRCPFVLDYRDLWSRNLHHPSPRAMRKEATILAKSAGVAIVSPSWAMVLDRDFLVGSKVCVVSNGYDAEELASVSGEQFDHFAIVYAGVFYPPKRVVTPVMAALARLERDRPNGRWMFHYFGKHDKHVLEEAGRWGVLGRVMVHGHVSRQRALAAIKGADVAAVITSVSERGTLEDRGMVTGKIFDAIGLNTPILIVAPPDSDVRDIAGASGKARSFVAGDVEGIAAFIGALQDGTSLTAKDPGAYAWETLAGEMDRVLRETLRH